MSKKFIHFLFVLVVILSPACLAMELEQIISSGELRVAVKDTLRPPFVTCTRDGSVQGFEIDFVNECAKLLDVRVKIQQYGTSNEMVDAVYEGKADMAIGLLSRTPQRILKVNFTIPYAQPHLALLIHRQNFTWLRRDMPLEEYMRVYRGVVYAQEATSHLESAGRLFPEAKVKSVKQYEIDQLLEEKKLTVFCSDQVTIRALLDNHLGSRVFYQRVIFDDIIDNICIAVPVDSPRLLYWLNCEIEGHLKYFQSILQGAL